MERHFDGAPVARREDTSEIQHFLPQTREPPVGQAAVRAARDQVRAHIFEWPKPSAALFALRALTARDLEESRGGGVRHPCLQAVVDELVMEQSAEFRTELLAHTRGV